MATLLIGRLEQVVGFANRLFMDAPKLAEFFAVMDTVPAVRDRPDAVDPGGCAASSNSKTSRSPTTASVTPSPT